jgi:hypothetical protein
MINTYVGADADEWTSFEAQAMEGRRLLRLINDGSCVNIRSIVTRAEEYFQAMMATYPKQNRQSNEFGVNDLQAMIMEEYFGAIACIRDRVNLSEADRKLYEMNELNEFDPLVVAEVKELYQSLASSPHPIIRYSAQYNLGVCQFNNKESQAALVTFKKLEASLLDQVDSTHHGDVGEDKDENQDNDQQKSVGSTCGSFTTQALLTIRSTIWLVSKLVPVHLVVDNDPMISVAPDENRDVNLRRPSTPREKVKPEPQPQLTSPSKPLKTSSLKALYEKNIKSSDSVKLEIFPLSKSNSNRSIDSNVVSKPPSQPSIITGETYPYEILKGIGPFPTNVVTSMRENYLSDEEFHRVFRMDRQQYSASPQWKKVLLKKEVHLF